MKQVLLILAMTLMTTPAFADSTFRCSPPKNNPQAFLTDSYAFVEMNSDGLHFQQYDDSSNSLIRDYQYEFVKIAEGNSKVTGMMKFKLTEEIKSYGDSIYEVYVDPSMSDGKSGALIFTGQGYSWDWNFCKSVGYP